MRPKTIAAIKARLGSVAMLRARLDAIEAEQLELNQEYCRIERQLARLRAEDTLNGNMQTIADALRRRGPCVATEDSFAPLSPDGRYQS